MINLPFAIASAPRQLRRHVTPCQRAMGYAMRHPEPLARRPGAKARGLPRTVPTVYDARSYRRVGGRALTLRHDTSVKAA